MYLPHVFESTPEITRELLRAHPFATVVGVASGTELEIVHLPLLVTGGDSGGAVRISGHVARANPFARLVANEAEVTAAFHGPDAYVSASLYGAPHHEVPTWNYAVVHVRGRLRPLDDAGLKEQLTSMAERFERGTDRWHPDLLTPAFFDELRGGIVGFTIEVADVRAKLKLSQNRSAEDRGRVQAAFETSTDAREREVGTLMKQLSSLRAP